MKTMPPAASGKCSPETNTDTASRIRSGSEVFRRQPGVSARWLFAAFHFSINAAFSAGANRPAESLRPGGKYPANFSSSSFGGWRRYRFVSAVGSAGSNTPSGNLLPGGKKPASFPLSSFGGWRRYRFVSAVGSAGSNTPSENPLPGGKRLKNFPPSSVGVRRR